MDPGSFGGCHGRRADLDPGDFALFDDDIADAIVSECDAVSSVEDITLRLSARFAAPAEEIQGDVLAFLQTLFDQGLIQS